jgi:hypothetical protein
MRISGITPAQFRDAVAKANVLYDNNLRAVIGREYIRKDGTCQRFHATVGLVTTGYQLYGKGSELAPGQKRSRSIGFGPSQRRVNAACWHAYRDVLIELFTIAPDAKVSTMYAKYYGVQQFNDLFPATGRVNVGSAYHPITPVECCDCPRS